MPINRSLSLLEMDPSLHNLWEEELEATSRSSFFPFSF